MITSLDLRIHNYFSFGIRFSLKIKVFTRKICYRGKKEEAFIKCSCHNFSKFIAAISISVVLILLPKLNPK